MECGIDSPAIDFQQSAHVRKNHELRNGILEKFPTARKRHTNQLHVDVDFAQTYILELLR